MNRKLLAGLVAVLAMIGMTTSAFAATNAAASLPTGVYSNGHYVVCQNSTSLRPHAGAESKACATDFQKVTVNIQGPAGPKGATGTQGVQGPKGDAGAAGADGADASFSVSGLTALSNSTTLDTVGGPIRDGAKQVTNSIDLAPGVYAYNLSVKAVDNRTSEEFTNTAQQVQVVAFLEKDLGQPGYDWNGGEALGNTIGTGLLTPNQHDFDGFGSGGGVFTLSETTKVFVGAGGYQVNRGGDSSGKVDVTGVSASFVKLNNN